MVAAIDAGQITVCDAASVVTLPKAEQRQALAAVRSGKARTVRQAAKKAREAQAARQRGVPGLPHIDESVRHSPKRLRRVARRFNDQCDTLLRYLDLATAACGGPSDYTRRMRDGIQSVRRTMHDCTNHYCRRNPGAP